MPGSALDWPLSRDEKRHYMLQLFDKDVQTANYLLAHSEAERKALRKSLDAERVRRASGSTASASSRSAHSSKSRTSSEASTDNPSGKSVSSCTSGEEEHLHHISDVAAPSPKVMRQALKKLQERRRDKLKQLQRRSTASYRAPPPLVNRRSVAEPEPDPPDIDSSTVEGAAMPGLPKASSKGLAKGTWNPKSVQDRAAASTPRGLDVIFAGIRAPWFTSTAEHSLQPHPVAKWLQWQEMTPRLPENQGGCSVLDWACCGSSCRTSGLPEGRVVTRKLDTSSRSCGMFGW